MRSRSHDARTLAEAAGDGAELCLLAGAGHRLRADPRAMAVLVGLVGASGALSVVSVRRPVAAIEAASMPARSARASCSGSSDAHQEAHHHEIARAPAAARRATMSGVTPPVTKTGRARVRGGIGDVSDAGRGSTGFGGGGRDGAGRHVVDGLVA